MPKPTPATPGIVTKAEFAALCNVAPSRVSHWIRDGRINGAALSGEGRSARIVVAIAQKQLRDRLDPYQMLQGGNGEKTRLDARTPGAEPTTIKADEGQLTGDDDALWEILSEVPSDAAWQVAEAGETTQRAFDVYMGMRMNLTSFLRMRGFVLPEGEDHFAAVDWPGLAEEMGMILVNPKRMRADWQRRRDAAD